MWETLRFLYTVIDLPDPYWRSRNYILKIQRKRFRELLLHAARNSPFYQRKYQGLDLERCRISDVPPVTKAELMAHFDEVVTDRRIQRAGVEAFVSDPQNLGRHYLDEYVVSYTSGSQGQPALIVYAQREMELTLAVQVARGHTQSKSLRTLIQRLREPSRMAFVTLGPGFYPSGAAISYLPKGTKRLIRVLWLSRADSLADNIARLNEFRPNVLTSFASVLEALAREERAGRLQLKAKKCLRQITNISEPLSPLARRQIEQTFEVPVTDHYAMGECLALSFGCPQSPGSHLNADLAMLEVVDDKGQPVPDGQAGSKVLLTNLYNRTQPFIRYEIDDVVTMSPAPCTCGRKLPLIQSIGGRSRDKLWVEVDGEIQELSYYVFVMALHHFKELAEHQIIQTGHNRVVVRVAPQPGKTVEKQSVQARLRERLQAEGLKDVLEISLEIVEEIKPDPKSGKMKRVLNLVGPPASTDANSDLPESSVSRNRGVLS